MIKIASTISTTHYWKCFYNSPECYSFNMFRLLHYFFLLIFLEIIAVNSVSIIKTFCQCSIDFCNHKNDNSTIKATLELLLFKIKNYSLRNFQKFISTYMKVICDRSKSNIWIYFNPVTWILNYFLAKFNIIELHFFIRQ